jgi:hypothetical protein
MVHRETIFECRTCGNACRGFTDGSFKGLGWCRIEGIDGPNAICPSCAKISGALDSLKRDGYDNAHVVPGTSVLVPAVENGKLVWWDTALMPPAQVDVTDASW